MLSSILGDEVEVTLGGQHFVLRPTLRAAITAFRMHDGFGPLFEKVDQGDTDTLMRLVRAGAGPHCAIPKEIVWTDLAFLPRRLTEFVLILAHGGIKPDPAKDQGEDGSEGGETVPWEDYFARLLKYGVGWIGWTVDQTLDTPMPVINSAFVGRMDMVAWSNGWSTQTGRSTIPVDEKLKAGMAFLGTRKVRRAA